MMTSRERLLAAIRCEPVDRVPFAVRFWGSPRHERATWEGERERLAFYARHEWDAHLDAWCFVRPAPDVVGEVRHERDDRGAVLHQVWHTPAGEIHERLRVTDDWPEARAATQCVGLLHDFRPPRYVEVPFKTEEDLNALPYLLPVENAIDDDGFTCRFRELRELAVEFGVPVFADVRSGLDWLVWLFGAEQAVLRALDAPDMIRRLLDHVAAAYRRRIGFLLELGIDGVIRSGWYESADLWSPELYRALVLPTLEEEIRMTEAAGVPLVYLMDSGVPPLLPDLDRLRFHCLAGVDPATAGGTDLAEIRRRLPGKSIWGGISGPLHLGRGTPAEVEQAVTRAFDACGKTGLILGPAVGFRHNWPWQNLEACDRVWRRLRNH